MLLRSVDEECCKEVMGESVGEECRRRVLEKSVVEKCWMLEDVRVLGDVWCFFWWCFKDTQIFGQGQIMTSTTF